MIAAAAGAVTVCICGFYSELWLFGVSVIFCFGLVFFIIKKNVGMIVAVIMILAVALCCFSKLREVDRLQKLRDNLSGIKAVFIENTYENDTVCLGTIEVLESDDIKPSTKPSTKLSVWYDPCALEPGEIFTADISPEEIENDYKASNYSENIFLSGTMTKVETVGAYDPVLKTAEDIRDYIRSSLFRNMDYDDASTVCALVFGDKRFFSDEFYDNVRNSGVSHVMVVSGMHLSILVTSVLKVTEKFIYNPRIRALTMFMAVIIMCLICGFTMSIMRAGVTYVIMAAGLLLNRPYSGENALGTAVVLISMASPFAIFSIAFQLSVLSTFGILAVALPVCGFIKDRKIINSRVLRGAVESAVISLSALVMTLPVAIQIFKSFSCVSVITNMLISIPVSVSLVVTVAALIIYPVLKIPAMLMFYAAGLIVKYINRVINFMGELSFAVVEFGETGVYVSLAVIAVIFWIMIYCKKRADMIKLDEIRRKIIAGKGKRKNGGHSRG